MLASRAGRSFARYMPEKPISAGFYRHMPCGLPIRAAFGNDGYSAPRLAKSLSLKPSSHSVAK
jgi:hypothetical protein